MTTERAPDQREVDGSIRATYEEYQLGDATVAMISDPQNEHAWIQSDVVQPVSD